MEYFNLTLGGNKLKLPIISVGRRTKLAQLSILGDVRVVEYLSELIADKISEREFDCLVGPEVKVVPLIHEIAKRIGQKRYVVCRTKVKPYMVEPMIIKPLAHFPKHARQLVLNGPDADYLKGKRVVIIDDVISTGVTIRMILEMMKRVEAQVVKILVVAKQGEQFDEIDNLEYLTELPVFKET